MASSDHRTLQTQHRQQHYTGLNGFVSGTGGSSPHTGGSGGSAIVPLADELKRLFTGHQRSPTGAGGSQQPADRAVANDFDSWARDGGLL